MSLRVPGHNRGGRADPPRTPGHPCVHRPDASRGPVTSAWLLGLAALLWIVVRSGRKPSRLGYPCQRAALASAALLLGPALAPALLALARPLRHPRVRAAAAGGVVAAAAVFGLLADTTRAPAAAHRVIATGTRPGAAEAGPQPAAYSARISAVQHAGGPAGDHHLGVDQLFACMGLDSLRFYKSARVDRESGPDGIVGAADLVLIKINSQWPQRGGTNTDVLRGLIARILEHPDGFTGEIVVVENTQNAGMLDWTEANAEDHSQSAQDVVNHFAAMGRPVSGCLWDSLRGRSVNEYSSGDMSNGYVVGDWQPLIQMRVSYPKFRTARGRWVSLKQGLWNPATGTYSDSLLTFLSVPVLKCHVVYGVTAAVKLHVGTMTTGLSTSTHSAVRYGGLGAFLGEVRLPDLNILDAIYILAVPSGGPSSSYSEATRADWLLAARDPVALDMWATANVLVPAILANGYTSYPAQDPWNPSSIFRIYLDASMKELVERGHAVTNDLTRIGAHVCDGAAIGVAPAGGAPRWTVASVPNPTAGGARIRFDLPAPGEVKLEIYDAAGTLLRSIRQGLAAGSDSEILWDGRDGSRRAVPAGTYFYRVSAKGFSATGKTTIVR